MQILPRKLTAKQKLIHKDALMKASDFKRSETELLEVLLEVDRLKVFRSFGFAHLTPYCQRALGLSEDVALNFVRIIRKSLDVPELAKAVIEGEISFSNARTVASAITAENKNEWLEKAKCLTKSVLEKEILKASGKETKPLDLELGVHDLLARVQEILCAKLDHYPSKEEALRWALEFTLDRNSTRLNSSHSSTSY